MHPGLGILDILENILLHVAADKPHRILDLAALARTCKIFKEPALDALWRSQNTLNNILRLLPSDAWSEELETETLRGEELETETLRGQIHIIRRIEQWEWKIPLTYSRRVRSLKLFGLTRFFPASDVLEAIRYSFTEEYLFPNLRSLTWKVMVQDVSLFSDIRLFLSPKVTRTNLHVPATEPIITLLPSLPIQFPELQKLGISSFFDPESSALLSRAVSIIALKLFRIERLSVNVALDRRALEHLSGLPNLQSLDFHFLDAHELGPRSLSLDVAYPFPTLNHLAIETRSREGGKYALELLTLLSHCRLQTFHVCAQDMTTSFICGQLYTAMADPSTLHSVNIFHVNDRYSEMLLGPPMDYMVNGRVLAPLFCFANLTEICLCPPAGFDIDDVTAWNLARAWPKLELLMLNPSAEVDWRDRLPPINMTLHGLRAFAEHCKRLKELSIHVNATEVPPLEDDSTEAQVSSDKCLLEYLCVGVSPISDPPTVAGFLCVLFPDLSRIDTSVDAEDWDGWEDDGSDEKAFERLERSRHLTWIEVEKLLM